MIRQQGFLFQVGLCIGCRACEVACRNEHQTGKWVRWRWVSSIAPATFLSISCNHCTSPECFRVCPQRAYTKRRDGIVLIDSDRCDGCKTCIKACPYQAPQLDPERNKVTKCDFCLPRRAKNLETACVSACHTGALQRIELGSPQEKGTILAVEGFPDIRLTRPSIRFVPGGRRVRFWLEE
ncbi:MAG TPA: 4Fe-4S dicluster domain-containing protein [Clostridia bacterium]|nr:4Fe-4S dicluster domain-containing protein [Clostridia bacterium]